MASPKTLAANARTEKVKTETRARVTEVLIKERGIGPAPRTSTRWMGDRTKGLPYSRMKLVHLIPAQGRGRPSIFFLDHPTRARRMKVKQASPELLRAFFPSLPEPLAQIHLGLV